MKDDDEGLMWLTADIRPVSTEERERQRLARNKKPAPLQKVSPKKGSDFTIWHWLGSAVAAGFLFVYLVIPLFRLIF